MAVDTEKKHFKCSKCSNVVSVNEYQMKGYARNKTECSKGGNCNWKTEQTSWNKSLPGMIFGLIGKLIKR